MGGSSLRKSSGRRTAKTQPREGALPRERAVTDSGGLLARRGPWWTPQPHRRGVARSQREASQPLRTPPPASKATGRSGAEDGAAASGRVASWSVSRGKGKPGTRTGSRQEDRAERESSSTRSRLRSPASKGAGRSGVEDRAATSTPEALYERETSRSESRSEGQPGQEAGSCQEDRAEQESSAAHSRLKSPASKGVGHSGNEDGAAASEREASRSEGRGKGEPGQKGKGKPKRRNRGFRTRGSRGGKRQVSWRLSHQLALKPKGRGKSKGKPSWRREQVWSGVEGKPGKKGRPPGGQAA